MSKKLLDFRREKSEMKIEEDLILYLLKRNKDIFSMTAEEKEELETRKKRLLYLLVLILIFAIFPLAASLSDFKINFIDIGE